MENFVIYSVLLLTALMVPALYFNRAWSDSITNLLFANRSLNVASSALAITSHWFWAIAIFVSPAVAYNWGIIGLLWFVIPNALSLIVVGLLSSKVRKEYPDEFSLTELTRKKLGPVAVSFYYVMYTAVALAGMLLGFTALFKFFTFVSTDYFVSPIYLTLLFGLITIAFTAMGGIRTSIFTGCFQTIGWLAFLSVAFYSVSNFNFDFLYSLGKNQLTTILNPTFLTTYAIAFLITIIVGATSHGMMWQKSFSMPQKNILPSYIIASVIFAVMVFLMGSLGLYAYANNLTVPAPDLSQLTTITQLGPVALLVFGILLVGQTATVLDSCLNYISSVTTREWLHSTKIWVVRSVMVVAFALVWCLTWLKLEVWTIFMLMGVLRVSMFMPLVGIVNGVKFNEKILTYSSIVAVSGALYLSWFARTNKLPMFDMYSALFAIGIGLGVFIHARASNRALATT